MYQIKTEDFDEDMKGMQMKGMQEHYHVSEYSKESELYDGKK